MPRDDIICSARAIALYVWAFANPIFSALRHMDRYRLYIFYFIFIRHLYHNNRSYVTKIVWQTHIRFLYYYYYYAFTVELNKKKKVSACVGFTILQNIIVKRVVYTDVFVSYVRIRHYYVILYVRIRPSALLLMLITILQTKLISVSFAHILTADTEETVRQLLIYYHYLYHFSL